VPFDRLRASLFVSTARLYFALANRHELT